MKIDPGSRPRAGHSGEDLLATVPEVANHARFEVKNVSNAPSDYMDAPGDRAHEGSHCSARPTRGFWDNHLAWHGHAGGNSVVARPDGRLGKTHCPIGDQ